MAPYQAGPLPENNLAIVQARAHSRNPLIPAPAPTPPPARYHPAAVADLSLLARALPAGAGALGLLSGDEFTDDVLAFDRALLDRSGTRVGLILDADPRAAAVNAESARAHFERLGARAFVLDLHHTDPLPAFDLAYLGGGSPRELLGRLAGTPGWAQVEARWCAGAALAGSSAGAMALCEACLVPEEGAPVPTVWTTGLGAIPGLGLAVHASSRSRDWLDQITSSAPAPVLCLDDHTGVIIAPGEQPFTAGPGRVWFATPGAAGRPAHTEEWEK